MNPSTLFHCVTGKARRDQRTAFEKALLEALTGIKEALMATADQVSTALDNVGAKLTELVGQGDEIAQALRDLKAAGGATPEQLDALVAKAEQLSATAQGGIDATKDVDPTP